MWEWIFQGTRNPFIRIKQREKPFYSPNFINFSPKKVSTKIKFLVMKMNFSGNEKHFYTYRTARKPFYSPNFINFSPKKNFLQNFTFLFLVERMNFSGNEKHFYTYKTARKTILLDKLQTSSASRQKSFYKNYIFSCENEFFRERETLLYV